MITHITSKDNKHYKILKKLRQKKYRDQSGLFLAEGFKFLTEGRSDKPEEAVREVVVVEDHAIPDVQIPVTVLSKAIFRDLSSQEHSQGIILVCKKSEDIRISQSNKILVLDDVRDPGNMGMILRVADAAGYEDVILTKGCVDPYHEKSVRSSMGSIFHVRLRIAKREVIYEELKENGFYLYMTALRKQTIDYRDVDWAQKHAVIFGNEGHGLSDEVLNFADEVVSLPIYGKAESLNVAVCTGIVLYEAAKNIC